MPDIFTKKHFYLINALGLTITGLILANGVSPTDVFLWPVGPFIAVYLVSSLAFYTSQFVHHWSNLLLMALIALISYWVLSGFLTSVLERFFRSVEHYRLVELPLYFKENVQILLLGILWLGVYAVIFHLIKIKDRLSSTAQKAHMVETELASAQLNSLRKEINPHFLFNAMNGIAMKVRLQENKTAVAMIAALNDLLRLSLGQAGEKTIPLHQEMELLDKYLLIEKYRFGDAIELVVEIPNHLQTYQVPDLILQPLVENAFKHGTKEPGGALKVKITAAVIENDLELSIYNAHIRSTVFNYATSGVGLPNVVHRLRSLYGTDFKFQSYNSDSGILFKMTIPAQS